MKGKKLENDVKKYLKDNGIFFHKFTDSFASRGISQPVPADYVIWPSMGASILLECKETEKARIPLSAFRPSQFKAMNDSLDKESVNYYTIISYNKKYYLIHAKTILDILDSDEKSIYLEDGYLAIDYLDEALDFMLTENAGL